MKFLFLTLLTIVAMTGCATRQQVARMEGHGRREVYNASYDQVWRAAIDAAQVGDLRVVDADRANGFIAAGRGIRPHTFGENVGIWVRAISPTQTEVEVTSQQAGPPALWLKNWERDIFAAVRANLTRDAAGQTLVEPSGAGIEVVPPPSSAPPVQRRLYVPEQALPPVAPP